MQVELDLKEDMFFGWSRSCRGQSFYVTPNTVKELCDFIGVAKTRGWNVCTRGGGRSYGDEIINENNLIVDCKGMNRILSWDPKEGVLVVEPGVTLQQVLRICLSDRWILPVVPGTQFATIGGCAANNIHGKNSFKQGNFGDCVLEFDLLLPTLDVVTCSREKFRDLFFSCIGGLGLLGIFTRLKIQLKKVISSSLSVRMWTVPNLDVMIHDFIEFSEQSDYIVGQIDCFKRGYNLGRGTIHTALLSKSETSSAGETEPFLESEHQWLAKIGRMVMRPPIMRLISSMKYCFDSVRQKNGTWLDTFSRYNFYLDHIPYWPGLYKNGFYEFEPLIPTEKAAEVYRNIINLCHEYQMPPFVGGMKFHRKDDFLLSFALDGFSVGFDFPVLSRQSDLQREMFNRMFDMVVNAGGIIYLAKDSIISSTHMRNMYNESRIDNFLAIKKKYDPEVFFQSNMCRRVFIM